MEDRITIVVTGLRSSQILIIDRDLKKRGFAIEACMEESKPIDQISGATPSIDVPQSEMKENSPSNDYDPVLTLAVKLTSVLFMKLSIQLDLLYQYDDTNSRQKYIKSSNVTSSDDKFTVLSEINLVTEEAIRIIRRYVDANLSSLAFPKGKVDIWAAHNPQFDFSSSLATSLNDTDKTREVQSNRLLCFSYDLNKIAEYYGPMIGVYFGFLRFYTKCLIIPSILGILLFCHQLFFGAIESAWLPAFGIVMAIWGTLFLEFWKRNNAELNFLWSSRDRFDVESSMAREQLLPRSSSSILHLVRFGITMPAIGFVIYMIIRLMLFFNGAQMKAQEHYGYDNFRRYIPFVVYALLPGLTSFVFEPFSAFLTSFEGHPTKSDHEYHVILKKFALHFVNRYSSLLYTAFFLRDIRHLQSLLISLLLIEAIMNNVKELGEPIVRAYLAKARSKKIMYHIILADQLANENKWIFRGASQHHVFASSKVSQPASDQPAGQASKGKVKRSAPKKIFLSLKNLVFGTSLTRKKHVHEETKSEHKDEVQSTETLDAPVADSKNDDDVIRTQIATEEKDKQIAKWKKLLTREAALMDYDIEDDYLELLLQYGYVSMFAVAFPIAPFLAILNNFFEDRVDLKKLSLCKRVSNIKRIDIGAWYLCFEMINFLSVVTNCFLLCLITSKLKFTLPTYLDDLASTDIGRLIVAIILEHLILGFKVFLMGTIDDVPGHIRVRRALLKAKEKETLREDRLRLFLIANQAAAGEFDSLKPPEYDNIQSGEDVASVDDDASHQSKSSSIFDYSLFGGPRHGAGVADARHHSPTHAAGILPGETSSSHGSRIHSPSSHRDHHALSLDRTPQSLSPEATIRRSRGGTSHVHVPVHDHHNSYDAAMVAQLVESQERAAAHEYAHRQDGISSHLHSSHGNNHVDEAKKKKLRDIERREAMIEIERHNMTQFGFNPLTISSVTFLPLMLTHYGLPAWLYVPLSLLFFTTMQSQKESQDHQRALKLVSDSGILKYMLLEVPSWINDSQFQRVEWLNSTIQKVWPYISNYLGPVVMWALQPTLNYFKPAYLTCLSLEKVLFGTVAPKIVGVRFDDTEESVVRLDIELRWAGNPIFNLKVGTLPFPTIVEMDDFRLSANIRIEFNQFTSLLPFFGSLSVTCLRKPVIEFNLKIGGMDIMSLGPAEYNLSALVTGIIDSIIASMLLYPKKLVIPILDESSVHGSTEEQLSRHPAPIGVLTIKIIGAHKLKRGDYSFSTDPYVKVISYDETFVSSIQYNTQSPLWNESFDILVYDLNSQQLDIIVMDKDVIDTNIGQLTISVKDLNEYEMKLYERDLENVRRGKLSFQLVYIPLADTKDQSHLKDLAKAEEFEDILFHMTEDSSVEDTLHHGHVTLRQRRINAQGQRFTYKHCDFGVLVISNIRCRNLKPTSSLSTIASMKPYVSFSIGSTTKRTVMQRGFSDPSYDESFSFPIRDPLLTSLVVQVLDSSQFTSDVLVGNTRLQLSEIVKQYSHVEREYALIGHGENKECYAAFRLLWIPAK